MRLRSILVAAAVLAASVTGIASGGPAQAASSNSPNISFVKNVKWRGGGNQLGTDIEFATIKGREYALAGTYAYGLQIVDITDPRNPNRVATYECPLAQGDVQVFKSGGRTLATYTADDGYGSGSSGRCFRELKKDPGGRYGTFILDVSNPHQPKTVSFIAVPRGSHNATVHPSGQWLYNSDADLPGAGQIEAWDIRKPEAPKLAATLPIAVPASNAALLSAHDITFSADGKRAYAAALTHTVVIDTAYPGAPKVLGRIFDPAITLHHQADPITVKLPGGVAATFLVVTDELAGASANVACPGGGLHVYNITGPLESAPVKVGAFFIPEVRANPHKQRCTSHVLRMHPERNVMTIGWYAAGARVIDVSGLAGVALGLDPKVGTIGAGMREIAFFEFDNSETWSAKTNRIERDGSFFLYATDHTRGLDVFRYDAKVERPPASDGGTWLTPKQALDRAQRLGVGSAPGGGPLAPSCLIRGRG